jgi:hypothetical protein
MRSASDAGIACARRDHDQGALQVLAPAPHFFEQSSTMPLAGVGQEAVQAVPLWMLACKVGPSLDKQVAAAMISPDPHSELQPAVPQALPSIDLA